MFASPLFNCPCKTKPALTVANTRRIPQRDPSPNPASTPSGKNKAEEREYPPSIVKYKAFRL